MRLHTGSTSGTRHCQCWCRRHLYAAHLCRPLGIVPPQGTTVGCALAFFRLRWQVRAFTLPLPFFGSEPALGVPSNSFPVLPTSSTLLSHATEFQPLCTFPLPHLLEHHIQLCLMYAWYIQFYSHSRKVEGAATTSWPTFFKTAWRLPPWKGNGSYSGPAVTYVSHIFRSEKEMVHMQAQT